MRKVSILFLVTIIISYCSGQETITIIDAEQIASIDSIMNINFPPDEPGAAIIITEEGKEIYKKGFGMANLESGIQMTPEMIFRLGSLTKPFTAVSILLLEEEGKLSVEDDITRFLHDYPTHGAKITIENLLTHTSGIPDFTRFPNARKIEQTQLTTGEILELFKDKPLDFEPGEKFLYSNSGYDVLGAIIESVSGMSYEQFVENNIFQKLEMHHSFYDHPEEEVENKIPGYDKNSNGYKLAPYAAMCAPFSAGGLRSTVGDLAIFNKALHDGKLIPEQELSKVFSPFKLNTGELSYYGYGWYLKPFLGHTAYSHSGNIYGFVTGTLFFPESDIFIAMLSNNTSSLLALSSWKISAILLEEDIETNAKVPVREPEDYTGTYQYNNKQYVVSDGIDGLSLKPAFGEGRLLQIKNDVFYIDGTIVTNTFNRDSTGKVESFTAKNLYFGDELYSARRLIE